MASLKKSAVTQHHPMGCGLACVAFVAGVSYDDIFAKIKTKHHAWTRGFYCAELATLLKAYKHTYIWRRTKKSESPQDLPINSIVFIAPNQTYPHGHFLVKVGKNRFMNPWKNFPNICPAKSGFQNGISQISHVLIPQPLSL